MTPLQEDFWNGFRDIVLLQLFNKIKLRNETKTFLKPKFFLFKVKCMKLGFTAPITTFSIEIIIFSSLCRRG